MRGVLCLLALGLLGNLGGVSSSVYSKILVSPGALSR